MYPFIIKAHYWDEYEEPWTLKHIQVLLYAPTAADAVRQFETSNYVKNIDDIKAIYAGCEDQLFEIPGHIARILAAGGGVYRDGLEELATDEKIAKKLREDAEKVAPRENSTRNEPYVAPGTIAPWAVSNEEEA